VSSVSSRLCGDVAAKSAYILKTRRLRRSPGEWLLALRAAALLAAVSILLRIVPGWTLRRISTVRPASEPMGSGVQRLNEIVAGLGIVRPLAGTCLTRALTVFVLARHAGFSPSLVIGARRDGDRLAAHAWIECAGEIVPPQELAGLVRLWTIA